MTTSDVQDAFVQEVGRFIDARGLLPSRAGVLVGVSGGADSVTLLDVLRRLAAGPQRAYRLTVAHLNHRIRPDAQGDADFVADLARRWGVPCAVEQVDVPAEARRRGQGLEQAAREARYEFLHRVAASAGASHVAVAHHADDNVETILYRIIRGTHLRGLAGIPPGRRLGGSAIRLVRPLLGCTRSRIEEYCRAAGLAWRTDSTNADTEYRRNFIRHELLPLLRSRLNRRAEEAILRLAEAAAGAEEILSDLAEAALENAGLRIDSAGEGKTASVNAVILAAEQPLVRATAIRTVLENLGVPMRSLDAERLGDVQRMLEGGEGPAAISLPGGWRARVGGRRLVIEPLAATSAAGGATSAAAGTASVGAEGRGSRAGSSEGVASVVAVLECPGRTSLGDGRTVLCRIEPFDAAAFERHRREHPPGEEWLDADQVRGRLLCRPRQPGDAFVPLGCPGRQSVSDLLTNRKLPPSERGAVLCISDELGIVWVAPLRIDERVKVAADTRNVLKMSLAGG